MPFSHTALVRTGSNEFSYRTNDLRGDILSPSYFNPAKVVGLKVTDIIVATAAIGVLPDVLTLLVTATDPIVVVMSVGSGVASLSPVAFNPSKSMKYLKYRSARARTDRNCRVAFVGDSTYAGTAVPATNNQVIRSLPMQVARLLRQMGIPAGANNRFGCASNLWTSLLAMDGRCSSTGAWSQTGSTIAGGNGFGCNTAAAGSATFTFPDAVSKYAIYWQNSGTVGKIMTYQVDAGATTNLTTTGSSNIMQTIVDAGSVAAHTLTLAQATNNFALLAVDAWDGSRPEISCWNWGIAGATSTALTSNAGSPFGRMDSYAYFAPDLSIVEGGIINDWRQSIPVATTKANLTALVGVLKASGDVLLYTPRFDNGTSGASPSQEAYVAAMYEVGAEQGIDVWDNRTGLGSYALANAAGMYGDEVHGDGAGIGYADEAARLVRGFFLTI